MANFKNFAKRSMYKVAGWILFGFGLLWIIFILGMKISYSFTTIKMPIWVFILFELLGIGCSWLGWYLAEHKADNYK